MKEHEIVRGNRKVIFEEVNSSKAISICLYENDAPVMRIKHRDAEIKNFKSTNLYRFLQNFLVSGLPDIPMCDIFDSLGNFMKNGGEVEFIKEDFRLTMNNGSRYFARARFFSEAEDGLKCLFSITEFTYYDLKSKSLEFWAHYINCINMLYVMGESCIRISFNRKIQSIEFLQNHIDLDYVKETGNYIKLSEKTKRDIIKAKMAGYKSLNLKVVGFTEDKYAIVDFAKKI